MADRALVVPPVNPEMLAWLALALIAVFAAALAALSVSRRLPGSRVVQAAGTAAVSPQRQAPARETAVQAVTSPTRPFGYDNGVTIGDRS